MYCSNSATPPGKGDVVNPVEDLAVEIAVDDGREPGGEDADRNHEAGERDQQVLTGASGSGRDDQKVKSSS